MDLLKGLEPDRVFHFFEAVSDIPRSSGKTEAVRDYLLQFAEERSLVCSADEGGNVVIKKAASEGYEEAPAVIMQSHMDMVCVKTADSEHNFDTDALELFVEGDTLYADGTSLGADDGIGMAMTLAVLDDDTLAHPAIEAVFTNDEEIGLLGASAFDASVLQGKRMLNLDSETEGVFTCGCAGGSRVDSIIPVNRMRMKGLPVVITVCGLAGGHSGEAIDTYRPNANKLIGRILYELTNVAAYSLEGVSGGEKDNAIPVEAKARLVIDEEDYPIIITTVEKIEKELKKEFRGIDNGVRVKIEKGNPHKMDVLDMDSQDKIISFLLHTPNGVLQMSGQTPGLVQTSCNLGIVRTGEKEFAATTGTRSSVASGRKSVELAIREISASLGGGVHIYGDYPAWEYRESSPLRDTMTACYRELFGAEPVVQQIHAGLECGLFAEKINGLDAVAIGPTVTDIHTTDEKLSISSVQRSWELIKTVLAALK
ncbi:MAG: aminoacyl-histidine dipeptidase [Lachnospiraceae bacterium]|nr:aminoacyl-histidine dipeptidase [Lachnospiraceae bacterium]